MATAGAGGVGCGGFVRRCVVSGAGFGAADAAGAGAD